MFYKFYVTERNKVCIVLQHIATFYQGLHCYKDKTLFSQKKKKISFDCYSLTPKDMKNGLPQLNCIQSELQSKIFILDRSGRHNQFWLVYITFARVCARACVCLCDRVSEK